MPQPHPATARLRVTDEARRYVEHHRLSRYVRDIQSYVQSHWNPDSPIAEIALELEESLWGDQSDETRALIVTVVYDADFDTAYGAWQTLHGGIVEIVEVPEDEGLLSVTLTTVDERSG